MSIASSTGSRRLTTTLVITALCVACDAGVSDSTTSTGTSSGGTGAVGGAGGSSSSSDNGGSTSTFDPTGGNNGTGGFVECAGEPHIGKLTPVDVVMMLDQSGSMDADVGTTTVWGLVTDALSTFVSSTSSEGLGVGLQYFPIPDGPCLSCDSCFLPDVMVTDTTTNECCCSSDNGQSCNLADGDPCPGGGICFDSTCYTGANNATCSANDYEDLEVPVGLLPGVKNAILSSLADHGPKGLTPTAPALSGAIQAAQTHAALNPDHVTAVVLATDGVPTECSPTVIADIASIAQEAAAASPPVLTYVIGIGDVGALDTIAEAGGTNGAYLVTVGNNAGQAFLDAMNEIHGSLLACEFDIPQPDRGDLDYNLVNVQLTPNGQPTQTFVQVANAGSCTADGWYYDNPQSPTKIVLCPGSCDLVKSYTDAELNIVLGCATIAR